MRINTVGELIEYLGLINDTWNSDKDLVKHAGRFLDQKVCADVFIKGDDGKFTYKGIGDGISIINDISTGFIFEAQELKW